MLLKLKAKLYQYTQVFLARKEQDAYIKSIEKSIKDSIYLRSYTNIMNREDLQYSYRMEISMAIGQWQCDNGFTTFSNPYSSQKRISSLRKQKTKYLYYFVMEILYRVFYQAKWDIERMVE